MSDVDRVPVTEQSDGRPIPLVSAILDQTATWLATHPIDIDTLRRGPLGEALTRKEIEEVAGDEQKVGELIALLRASAERERVREVKR